MFGDHPAPTMAIMAMQKTAKMNKERNPKAAKTITKNAYVNDICDSVQNVEEAKAMTSRIDKVLKTSGFRVKKWISNANLADDNHSEEVVLGSEAETERVLGTVWHPEQDMLTFKIKMVMDPDATQYHNSPKMVIPLKLTKRILLSKLVGIFDPIGAATTVLI